MAAGGESARRHLQEDVVEEFFIYPQLLRIRKYGERVENTRIKHYETFLRDIYIIRKIKSCQIYGKEGSGNLYIDL